MEMNKLQARHREILSTMAAMEEKVDRENRKMNEAEVEQYTSLMREDDAVCLKMRGIATEAEVAKMDAAVNKSAKLREYLKDVKAKREAATTVLKSAATGNESGNLDAGEAVQITINELIDTAVEGIDLPKGLKLLTGVTGDEVWPYSIDDVEVSVNGEVQAVSEQNLNFDNVKAHSERVALAVSVSNKAIDNASFNLYDFVTYKIQKAIAIFKARRVYSHAAWNDQLKGAFSLVDAGTIALDSNFAKNLAKKVAEIFDKGFTGTPEIIIDKVTEAELSFTPKIGGDAVSGTVIENGKLAGFDYITSAEINGKLGSDKKYAKETDHYVGIGIFDYLAFEQHGDVRFTVDSTSAEVSKRNTTVFTLNTDFSLTELSGKVNGNDDGKPQAFVLLKITTPSNSNF